MWIKIGKSLMNVNQATLIEVPFNNPLQIKFIINDVDRFLRFKDEETRNRMFDKIVELQEKQNIILEIVD